MDDKELIAHALNMWANYIETGNPILSAVDAERKERERYGTRSVRKALDVGQMKTVVRLRELASRVLSGAVVLIVGKSDIGIYATELTAEETSGEVVCVPVRKKGGMKCDACNGTGSLCSKEARWEECFWCGGTGRK